MAESLGDAVLTLRTDDTAFKAGVGQAEGRAQALGQSLDKASGSSGKLAAEMIATGRSAQQMGAGFEAAGQRVTASAGMQRAGMQQLGLQLNDIATMYALGARPMQIFASQSGQVIQSVQLMAGGSGRLAAFLAGPWGLALTTATVALTPFIGALFESEDALANVTLASDGLGDAQRILGSVIDETTGRINTQSAALLALARAQAAVGRIGAIQRQAEARGQMEGIVRGGLGDIRIEGSMGGARLTRASRGQDVIDRFLKGQIGASFAIGSLESRMKAGSLSASDFAQAASAIANFSMEGANIEVFEDAQKALNGDATAARGVLGPGPQRRTPRPRRGPQGPNQAEIDQRFDSDLSRVTQAILQARLRIATSGEERAEIAERMIEWDRREALAQIAANEQFSEVQRAELAAATNRLANAELDAVAFDRRVELAREAQALADERGRGELEALQNAAALADTEAERKAVALRLLEAEERLERLRLQAIVSAEETDAAERARAEAALANLEGNSAGRRAATERGNETTRERFLRNLDQTPGQINEAIDGIKIDGLNALNDGLAEAIMGAENLADVFSRVADQIIADLLRIAIQRAIIGPLANATFGAGGGGLGALAPLDGNFSALFAGAFAKGGTIPTGQFGIVGEAGPELAFAGAGGLGILSNPESRALMSAGGASINMPISIDATGADAAAIARVNASLDQLRAELPGRIVATVQEASSRRVLGGTAR